MGFSELAAVNFKTSFPALTDHSKTVAKKASPILARRDSNPLVFYG